MDVDIPKEELGPSYVSFAVVARIAAERIGEMKRAVAAVPDTKIIYFKIAARRLRVIEDEWLDETNPDMPRGDR